MNKKGIEWESLVIIIILLVFLLFVILFIGTGRTKIMEYISSLIT